MQPDRRGGDAVGGLLFFFGGHIAGKGVKGVDGTRMPSGWWR